MWHNRLNEAADVRIPLSPGKEVWRKQAQKIKEKKEKTMSFFSYYFVSGKTNIFIRIFLINSSRSSLYCTDADSRVSCEQSVGKEGTVTGPLGQ